VQRAQIVSLGELGSPQLFPKQPLAPESLASS